MSIKSLYKKTQQILLLQEILIIPNENINSFCSLSHGDLLSMKRNFDTFCSTGSNIAYTTKKRKRLKQVGDKNREMIKETDDMVIERHNRIISEGIDCILSLLRKSTRASLKLSYRLILFE